METPATYTFKDFLEDWGPDGYYGPVSSYHYEDAELAEKRLRRTYRGRSKPLSPFPAANDSVKQNKTKEVRLIVEFSDQSIAFQP